MSVRHERENLYTMRELSERGWTPAMVRDLLGEADDSRPNPFYASGADMRLWLRERTHQAERTEEWARRRTMADRRSAASKRAANAKRANLLEKVEQVQVQVPALDEDELRRRAITSFNRRAQEQAETRSRRGGWYGPEPVDENSDPQFLERITVNYVRHELTRYDQMWSDLAGQVGREQAHRLLRGRVLDEIARVYPALAGECERQKRRWEAEHDLAAAIRVGHTKTTQGGDGQ